MAVENNTTLTRYNISNFVKFDKIIGDYDIIGNKILASSIKEIPEDGIKATLSSPMLRLDALSYELYGTTALWWLLAIYNDVVDLYSTSVTEVKYPSLSSIESWYFTNREKLLVNQE